MGPTMQTPAGGNHCFKISLDTYFQGLQLQNTVFTLETVWWWEITGLVILSSNLHEYGTPFGSKLITSAIRSNFLDRGNFLTNHVHSTLYLIRSCRFDTKFYLMGLNQWTSIDDRSIHHSLINNRRSINDRRSIADLDHSMGNKVVRE